jgi:hypothetical protein
MKIPAFLLRRLYVKGSLKGTPEGLEFQLRNRLGSGYAHRLLPLTVDGEELDMKRTNFEVDGKSHTFAEVSKETTFTLGMNKTTVIRAHSTPLASGPHKLVMRFEVAGLGELGFDFTDVVEDGA